MSSVTAPLPFFHLNLLFLFIFFATLMRSSVTVDMSQSGLRHMKLDWSQQFNVLLTPYFRKAQDRNQDGKVRGCRRKGGRPFVSVGRARQSTGIRFSKLVRFRVFQECG